MCRCEYMFVCVCASNIKSDLVETKATTMVTKMGREQWAKTNETTNNDYSI